MPERPELLTLKQHLDQGGRYEPIARRIGIGLLSVLCLLGLANLFGQRPGTSKAATGAASLSVYAPSHLRSGLYGEPLILVEDGKVIARNLARQRITLEEVLAEARLQQIAKQDEIQWAVLETSGQISFIKRS